MSVDADNNPPSVPGSSSWCKNICKRLFQMSEDGTLTDITLNANDGGAVQVHSCILSAASPVFAELLLQSMQSDFMIDAPSAPLASLRKLIYCGVMDTKDPTFGDVVKLAHNFQIISVKYEPGDRQREPKDLTGSGTDPVVVDNAEEDKSQMDLIKEELKGEGCDIDIGVESADPSESASVANSQSSPEDPAPGASDPAEGNPTNSGPVEQPASTGIRKSPRKPSVIIKEIPSEDLSEVDLLGSNSQSKHVIRVIRIVEAQVSDQVHVADADSDSDTDDDDVDDGTGGKSFPVSDQGQQPFERRQTRIQDPGGEREVCDKFFSTHEGSKRQLQCKNCPATFSSTDTLYKHNRHKHKMKNPAANHRCKICGWAKQKGPIGLDTHMLRVHGQRNRHPVQCELCGKRYMRKVSLEQHMDSAHRNILHQCEQCGLVTKSKYVLTAHIRRVHEGQDVRKYACDLCDEKFIRPYMLKDHLLHRHTKPDEWMLACNFCPKRFATKKKLRGHITCCHKPPRKQRAVTCQECKQVFTTRSMMEKHLHIVHLKDTTCTCEICGKKFPHPTNLRRHATRHTTTRDHVCKTCGSDFCTREDLQRHEQIHTKAKRFQCQFCSKCFLRRIYLEQHERIHTREKPLLCNVCGRAFRCTGNLNNHKRTQHPVEYQHEKNQNDFRVRREIVNPVVEEPLVQDDPITHEVVCDMDGVILEECIGEEQVTLDLAEAPHAPYETLVAVAGIAEKGGQ